MKKKVVAAAAVGAVVVAGLGTGAALAFGSDGETTERGTCAGTAYELNVDEDDGGLELEFELQAPRPGETWQVLVQQGDTTVLEGERTTDEDAELDLDAPVDPDGPQQFTVTATPGQGDECVATLTR